MCMYLCPFVFVYLCLCLHEHVYACMCVSVSVFMHVCASLSVPVHLYPCMCCTSVSASEIYLVPESCYAFHINSIKLIKLTFNYLSDSYLSNKVHIMCNYVTELTMHVSSHRTSLA